MSQCCTTSAALNNEDTIINFNIRHKKLLLNAPLFVIHFLGRVSFF